ncbi:hypothetical protein K470DRAFT_109991 [Piedraia hortae CBS 480.64]|uniref:Uncharacterized protein n=1 Tax=Piedraia hortae CBS 480.64 TaxID=1314780 RepID=A0A6A7BWN7_9PEZI|nr:hypothetical protein K470DRAFT_109991 [Piedraia hortae CBS 480.64]
MSTQAQLPAQPVKLSASAENGEKVKPCCVCKEEKNSRDECMLFSRAADPQEECKPLVDKYRACMKGYGFEIP